MQAIIVALALCAGEPEQFEREEPECKWVEKTPIGGINQESYTFDYQSAWGRGCRLYRLRNRAGGVFTSAIWKEHVARDSFVFLAVDLEDNSGSMPSPWEEAVHLSDEPAQKSATYIGFGANQDEHKQFPNAYRVTPAPTTQRFPTFSTLLRRVAGDEEKATTLLGVRVTSSVTGDAAPYELTYTVARLDPELTYELLAPDSNPPENTYGIVWEAATHREFLAELKRLEVDRVGPNRPEVEVKIQANAFDVVRTRLLRIVGANGRSILATSAVTYVPKTAGR